MFLNTVILVLQETLEASLLISILLVLEYYFTALLAPANRSWLGDKPHAWLMPALVLGLAGAWLYALATPVVSQWFDYVGFEVINALIQVAIVCSLSLFGFLLLKLRRFMVYTVWMVPVVALVIVREGSEIILYLQGVFVSPENPTSVMLGAVVGGGIGISFGVFLYYALVMMPRQYAMKTVFVLLALFAGNMSSQAVLLLTQADWLPYTPQLWDTSGFIAEWSLSGQLLYALVGYEANPSLAQAMAYLAGMVLVGMSPLFMAVWSDRLWLGQNLAD